MRRLDFVWKFIGMSTLAGWLLGACTADYEAGYVPDTSPPTLHEELARRAELALTAAGAEGGGSRISAVVTGELAGDAQPVGLELLGGELRVRAVADSELLLETLEADAGDASISEDVVPPSGCRLTGLHLSLEHVAAGAAEWSDDGEAVALSAQADLVFDWAVDFGDGEVLPLARLRLREVPFSLEVARGQAGDLRARLSAEHAGEFWSLQDWFVLSDLVISVDAAAPAPESGTGG